MCVLLAYEAPADSMIVRLSTAFSNDDVLEIHILFHELITDAFRNGYASGNIWQNYLTHFILTNENFFSLACERRDPPQDSLRDIALHDFEVFMRLFTLDNEHMRYIDRFTGHERNNSPVCEISKAIAESHSARKVYDIVTNFYRRHGTGIYALHKAFRLDGENIAPVANENVGEMRLDDIIGYDIQKSELRANTEAFLAGRPANNVLLYGDGGTGKSTSVKALLNEYCDEGLRVIEIFRHQFKDILRISESLRRRNYKFILFIDDLSFEEDESEYKYLKAVIEGGIEIRPENMLVYATSNRRHLVREIWSDRDDMEHNGDIHRSDTVEEKLSLSSRFGIALNYSSPAREMYHEIVRRLAEKAGLDVPEDELIAGSDRWEIRHGGKTGRAARQYVDYLMGTKD
ncbi:MAG: ATP-binding protein [Synergistaceae bacterium]|nr:ATP-binding protein [Synergistaceae bacterium]